ncbi:MAG: mevalonate kinase [Bacteroidota bacterium]
MHSLSLHSHYPAKLLLFGEYAIVKGGSALAIPYRNFWGRWQFGKNITKRKEWLKDLPDFVTYLENLHFEGKLLSQIDVDKVRYEVEQGLCFASNIPQGYGAGSSGAFCAGIYDRFASNKADQSQMDILQAQLAQLESFFHGSSSGMDPLVCFLQQGLLSEQGSLKPLATFPALEASKLFLLDSGRSRQTGPLVELFLERCEDPDYSRRLEAELMPLNEEAIQSYLNGQTDLLFDTIHQISHFQWKYFSEMIPREMKDLWLKGLSSDRFKLKLCGAGGGGFILGIGERPAEI